MSRIEQEKNINQQPVQLKNKEVEKSNFNLLSKFREFRQRATLLGFLTLAGIMGSCGDNPLINSSIAQTRDTEDNVKKRPPLKPALKTNTSPTILIPQNGKTIDSISAAENEKQKENYGLLDFVANELLTGSTAEKEQMRKAFLIHSSGVVVIYPTAASAPFIDALKKNIEQASPEITEQEKTDKLIGAILDYERSESEAAWNNIMMGDKPYASSQFMIIKQFYTNKRNAVKIKEAFFFNLYWPRKSFMPSTNKKEILKLYQTDTRNLDVRGTDNCTWSLNYLEQDLKFWQVRTSSKEKPLKSSSIVAPTVKMTTLSETETSEDSGIKITTTEKGGGIDWEEIIMHNLTNIKPGSNSPHLAWDDKLQDIVYTDNQLILGRAFASIENFGWPRPRFIKVQLLDKPIPINNPNSLPASQTENNLSQETPTLKAETQKEIYGPLDFITDELLIGSAAEKEQMKKTFLIHSNGVVIIYPIGTSIPFVDDLERRIEQENLKQQTKMTQQQKTDKLIETILGMEENGDDHYHYSDYETFLQFIIMMQLDDKSSIKMKENICFGLRWGTDLTSLTSENYMVVKIPPLYKTDTHNLDVLGTANFRWQLKNPADSKEDTETFILRPDAKISADGMNWDFFPFESAAIKTGSNSPHLAWDNKDEDVVLTDNNVILGKAFLKKINKNLPRPHLLKIQLLDKPIPINK